MTDMKLLVDDEFDRYEEAGELEDVGFPRPDIIADKVALNRSRGVEEFYKSMSSGGFAKIGERQLDLISELKRYDQTLRDAGQTPSVDDYYAFGADDDQILQAGLQPQQPEPSERKEPLTEFEQLYVERQGEGLIAPREETLRERRTRLTYETSQGELREIFKTLGIDEFTARQIAEGIWGNPESTKDLGIGIADFTPAGLFFGAEEGMNTLERGINSGDPMTVGVGALEAGLSFLEAIPATAAGAKALKRNIPAFRQALEELGVEAQKRIDAEGTTLFSNPVGPIVDRGLAAAGRLAEGEKPSVEELRRQANIARFGYDPNDPVAEVKAPTEAEPGIIAFHGSGADFDEFKLEKIGTGEGNQAFGYGLYFTDKEDIARFYRDSVGAGNEVTYKGKVIEDLDQDFADENNIAHMAGQQETPEDMKRVVADEVRRTRNNLAGIKQSIKDFQENPDVYPLKFHGMEISMETAEKQRDFLQRRLDAALEVQDNIGQIETKPAGTMYQVGLHVNPDELIDYDKTFDEQSAFVQEAILKVLDEVNLDDAMNMGVDVFSPPYNGNEEQALQATKQAMLDDFAVVRFLNNWSVLRGAENSGEELLEKHGVKGIKYKAQRGVGARNVPETGADNYVIFDDKLINIMKKYGIVGPVAVTAMKSEEQEET